MKDAAQDLIISYMSGRYQVTEIEFLFKSNICLFNRQNNWPKEGSLKEQYYIQYFS